MLVGTHLVLVPLQHLSAGTVTVLLATSNFVALVGTGAYSAIVRFLDDVEF